MERVVDFAYSILGRVAADYDAYCVETGDRARAAARAEEIREGLLNVLTRDGSLAGTTYTVAKSLLADFAKIIAAEAMRPYAPRRAV